MMPTQTYEKQPNDIAGLRPLFELTRAVSAAGRLEEVYDAALACLRDSLGVRKSSILRFDPDDVMRFKSWLNLSPEYRLAVEGHSPWTPSTRDPEPVLVADVREDAALAGLRPAIEAEGIRALAFVPLVIGGTLLGKFMLYYDRPHPFTEDEVALAQTIAAHVSFAIDQQENRRQRDILDTIFHSSGTGIAQIDAGSRLVVVNDRFCEITGRTREELLKLTCYDITHIDDHQVTRDSIQLLVEGASTATYEKRYVRPDGTPVWVSNSISPLLDDAGQLIGGIAVVTDITERKQAEDWATELARRYQSLVQALGLAVYTTDADGYITSFNEVAAELWGRRPERFKEMWCGSWRIFDEDGTPVPLDTCPMAVALKERRAVRDVEIVVERPDGTRANILPYPTPLFSPEGDLVGAVNVLVDITERKQAELRLAARNQLTEAITGNMSAGLIMVGQTGGIELMNPAAERITGFRFEELQGKNVHAALHHTRPDGSHYSSSDCPITQASRNGKSLTGHYNVFVRPDGTLYDVVCSVATLRSGRETLGAILDIRDVTVEKQAEKALRESEEALRVAGAIKDQFLGLVSHELRTPIATIVGNGLLLQRRGDQLQPGDRQQALADVVGEAGKLQVIIENLLMLTRVEAGQLELEPLVLSHVIEEAIGDFSKHNPARNVTFNYTPDLPPAQGQLTLVQLVIRNLLSNAAKYSPPGALIEVELYLNEKGAPEVSVRDFGIGMGTTDVDNVFEPFFRSDEARGRAQGMGLGLAVCKRVMEAQNGEIHAQSEPDVGSRFTFSLQPLRDA